MTPTEKKRVWYNANRQRKRNTENLWYAKRQLKLFGVVRPVRDFCKICGCMIEGRNLHLDHNHKTMLFRGWLCFRCNQFLGFYERYSEEVKNYLA